MKRTMVLAVALALITSACLPSIPLPQFLSNSAPTIDMLATEESTSATVAVQTVNALPTPTLIPATHTVEPTEAPSITPSPTEAIALDLTDTLTPDPDSSITANLTMTGTLAATQDFLHPTATETLHARFYGTLPPSIPYGKIKLVNQAKVEVYISMQCTTISGHHTILEYPVSGTKKVSAPAGKYTYVAWVGGKQFQGYFGLGKGGDISIIIKKDKIFIK